MEEFIEVHLDEVNSLATNRHGQMFHFNLVPAQPHFLLVRLHFLFFLYMLAQEKSTSFHPPLPLWNDNTGASE